MSGNFKQRLAGLFAVALATSLVTACGVNKPHEKAAMAKAQAEGMTAIAQPIFDGTFVAPDVDFAKHKKLIVESLDMDNVEILKPSSLNRTMDTPWVLSDKDKAYYRERYTQALIKNLVADGTYTTANTAAVDALTVRAKVLQIAPLASKDDPQGRPQLMRVYSEGMGTMTLEITLYDSVSGKALGIITDKRDLGRIWEENNRATNNIQVKLAFDAWLRKLRTELDKLSHRSNA